MKFKLIAEKEKRVLTDTDDANRARTPGHRFPHCRQAHNVTSKCGCNIGAEKVEYQATQAPFISMKLRTAFVPFLTFLGRPYKTLLDALLIITAKSTKTH